MKNAAIELLDVADRLGVSVPDDLSVVGFDNVPMAGLSRINLTNTRFTECWKARCTVSIWLLSLDSKLLNVCAPPPVKNVSPGFAEYFRSIAAASIGCSERSDVCAR